MKDFIEINGRRIGSDFPCYIVAEVSANHNGSFEQAVEIIKAAKQAGVDAIKLQTYTADTLTIRSDSEYFRIAGGTPWDGKTLYDLYAEAYTPWEWQPRLKQIANDLGLELFSTPFDTTAVDFLEQMSVPAHKVASFELVDLPLIEKIAATGKPMIISTGMATLDEIKEAVTAAHGAGASQIVLLKCTAAYPAATEDMNLRTIPFLAEKFQLPVGLSDHTTGIVAPVAAVVLGACLIEKHLTISRSLRGPDSSFSLEPNEFADMVKAVRAAESALGAPYFGVAAAEKQSHVFRRSLFVIRDMKRGNLFTEENVRSIRPAYGLHTRYIHEVLGCRSACDIGAGTPLSWDLVSRPYGPPDLSIHVSESDAGGEDR